jgi:branched-chain amino acid transport system permease protein
MTQFIQYVVGGLAVGAIYALVALGFVMVFMATDVFNFAHGNLMMLGAYFALATVTTFAMPFGVGVLATLVAAAIVGMLIQLTVIRPLIGQPLLIPVMVTVALSLVIRALTAIIWGPQERVFPTPIGNEVLDILGVRIAVVDLIVIGVALLIMAAFALFFRRSNLGLQMRATAESAEAALLSGVPVQRVFLVTFTVAAMLAAAGGILLAQVQVVSLAFGEIGLLALPAAVIGGLTSIPGAVVGGFVVGVLQQLAAGYIGTDVQEVVVFAALLVVIMLRPYGLLGEPEVRRV